MPLWQGSWLGYSAESQKPMLASAISPSTIVFTWPYLCLLLYSCLLLFILPWF